MIKKVTRESDGAVFEIRPSCKQYRIFRQKRYGEEVVLEPVYFTNLAIYGQDLFYNLAQAYQYLKTWIDWFY